MREYNLTPFGKFLCKMHVEEESLEVLFDVLAGMFETDPDFDWNESMTYDYLKAAISSRGWTEHDIRFWIGMLKKLNILK